MSSAIKISVVIPAFNRAGLIERAIASVIGQNAGAIETIVVDDGSTDDTGQRVERFGDRVVYLRQPNAGAPAARNRGLHAAVGEYVFFLDADDYYEGSPLEKIAQCAAAADADFAIGRTKVLSNESDIYERPHFAANATTDQILEDFFLQIQSQTAAVAWRRARLLDSGGWNENALSLQDIELFFRMVLNGAEGIVSPDGFVVYDCAHEGPRIALRKDRAKSRSHVEFLHSLRRCLRPDKRCHADALARLAYYVAREAYENGHPREGHEALAISRQLAFASHLGGPKHELVARLLGLRRKSRLVAWARDLRQLRKRRAARDAQSQASPSRIDL